MTNTNTPIEMPGMWVPKDISNRVEGNFNLQHFRLSQLINGTEADSIFIEINGFYKLIEYFNSLPSYKILQVFIASYDAGIDVVDIKRDKLTLLFGASASLETDATELYEIVPGGYQQDKNAGRWIKEYMTRKMPLLSDCVVHDPVQNLCKKTDSITNTRRISYEKELINNLVTILKTITKLKGFQAQFASFCNKGKIYPPTGEFINRIFVIFELVDNNNQIFYLEDEPQFKKGLKSTWTSRFTNLLMGVDNGHLCPPTC